jgi:regulatory protein
VAAEPAPFRDAEAWLAARGVPREPIRLEAADPGADTDEPVTAAPPPAGGTAEVRPREAVQLAQQVAADAAVVAAERAAVPTGGEGLEDEVARAVAFVRRSTAAAPQAEGRLRQKLSERGHPTVVTDLALTQARREGLVDDAAMVAALVDERRRAGHAPARIRRDLRARGFEDAELDPALAAAEAEDQEAAAFAVASERAARLTAAPVEAAYRRVAAHVARRGYPESLARKVARAAVFASREDARVAGH